MSIYSFFHSRRAQFRLCFFLLFVLFSFCLKAQDYIKIDSLNNYLTSAQEDSNKVKTLYELSIAYLYDDKEKSIFYANQTLEIAKKINYKKGIGLGYTTIANISNVYGDYDKGVEYYLKAIKTFEYLKQDKYVAYNSSYLADIHQILGNYQQALKYDSLAYNKFKALGMKQKELGAYAKIGDVFIRLEKFTEAELIYNEVLLSSDSIDYMDGVVSALTGISSSALMQENFLKAIKYYKKTLEVLNATPDNTSYSLRVKSILYKNIATAYAQTGQYNQALNKLDTCIIISKQIQDPEMTKSAYFSFYRTYELMEDWKNAFLSFKQFKTYEDSIMNENIKSKIAQMEEEYDVLKKEQEIVELNQENQILQQKSMVQKTIFVLSLLFIILLVIILVLFLQKRKINIQKEKAELEQKALRAQMNPHFIFNSLNSIQRMFMEGDYDMANDYMGDFSDLLRIILENSGKSTVNISNEINTLRLYLDIEKMRTEGMIEYQINVDPKIDLLNNFMPPLIIQPFVENAIWHGILPTDKKGLIKVDIEKKDEKTLKCVICDNGIGIEKSRKAKAAEGHTSRGMKITEARLNITNAVTVEELNTGGTKVTILIPLSKHHD